MVEERRLISYEEHISLLKRIDAAILNDGSKYGGERRATSVLAHKASLSTIIYLHLTFDRLPTPDEYVSHIEKLNE